MRQKWYKVPLMKIAIVLIAAGMLINVGGGLASAAEKVVITKTYELLEEAAYISYELEGYDGSFGSSMRMPDGRVVSSAISTKKTDSAGVAYWTNAYSVKSAPKGKYVFTIHAPKQSYYNLKIDLPLFSDVSVHWARAAIEAFVERGILSGYGNGRFGPNDAVTGEAFVKMAVLSLTEELPNGNRQWQISFRWRVTDEEVSKELSFLEYSFGAGDGAVHWSQPYIKAANDLGVISNWTEKDFALPFKRKDVALLAANIMRMVKAEDKPSSFTDVKRLSVEYQNAIGLVSNYSIFNGYPDGTFKPDNPVTRAEAVAILTRLTEFLK
ncbi:S-layer homology domain-containing protein [Paenibacillus harenae]|uniref:S-layer homology domain-containing protein n=1 Tax=Paenibacillus harenae TaxID=306543 RepID=UPI00278E242F|nr:S-layer homology domain-containing protein [Paenibacillus harenae]MDQ0060440.1 hypothetical protein [Paenibacillus harenae]